MAQQEQERAQQAALRRDHPKGWLRLLGPLSASLGGHTERRIWAGLKRQLEDDARAHPA